MRFRYGLVLCLLMTSLIGVGCRKALAPNIDRNQAPETWITAAPQDTITTKNPFQEGTPTEIPFKFHLYWAGSDPDGDIAGFYFAVVETLPYDPLGSGNPPSLPGPKARDYRFTTKTDSTFIFNVSDFSPDREHAFYIYAVDNEGKPDPTPARVIFTAKDKYPPLPLFLLARGRGLVWTRLAGGALVQEERTYFISDTAKINTLARDSIPVTARLDFQWTSEPTLDQNPTVQFRYKLDEVDFINADSTTKAVSYNTNAADRVGPGLKVFTLRAVDQAGAKRDAKRRFQFNLKPETWFSGPDPASPQFNQVEAGSGYHYYDMTAGLPIGGFTGSLLGPDSVGQMPAERPERKTFFEIYKQRIYVHSEWDTVNMNSWVVCHNGGLDPDSPYLVKVNPVDIQYRAIVASWGGVPPVLQPSASSNASPIGFRANLGFETSPFGTPIQFAQTGLYPIFDPTNVQRLPLIARYWPASNAGQAYMYARAEDGDGRATGGMDIDLNSYAVPNIVRIVGRDGNGGNDSLRALRRKILTFFVDHAPELDTDVTKGLKPRLTPPYTQYFSRVLDVNLVSRDVDPFDAFATIRTVGGPTAAGATRYRVTVRGVNAAGTPVSFTDYANPPYRTAPTFSIILPTWLVGTSVTLDIEVCDCLDCEGVAGSGRCTTYSVPVTVPPPPSAGAVGTNSVQLPLGEPGPGSIQDVRSAEQ